MKNILNNNKFKHGGLSVVITIIFLAVVIIVNIIASLLTERFPINIDLTKENRFELSTQTLDYLKTMEDEIDVYILAEEKSFSSANDYYVQANQVINKYAQYNDNIKVSYIDLYKSPDFVASYSELDPKMGDIIIDSNLRSKRLTSSDLFNIKYDQQSGKSYLMGSNAEFAMTSAIMYVTDKEPTTILYTTNHNETELPALNDLLKANSYDVKPINLLTEKIPSEANTIVISAPTSDYSKDELTKLDEFLTNGNKYGKNVIYIADAGQPKLNNLNAFLLEWGIVVEDGIVVETSNNRKVSASDPMYIMADYQETESLKILDNLVNKDLPFVSHASKAITPVSEYENGKEVSYILKTGEKVALMPSNAKQDWSPDQVEKNSYGIAVQSMLVKYDNLEPMKSFVIAFGSANTFHQQLLSNPSMGNAEYSLALFSTLTNKETSIDILTKKIDTKQLNMTVDQVQLFGIGFMVVVPLVTLIAGLVIWRSRRNK